MFISFPVTEQEAVGRARHFVGQGLYKLGASGNFPNATSPFDSKGYADCSAFIAWVLKYSRKQDGDFGLTQWWNTDMVLGDAMSSQKVFRVVAAHEQVIPSDVLVYESEYINGERKPGHIGLITYIKSKFVRGGKEWWNHLDVIHCAPRRGLTPGAVRLSSALPWRKKGYIVRYKRFTSEQELPAVIDVPKPKPTSNASVPLIVQLAEWKKKRHVHA